MSRRTGWVRPTICAYLGAALAARTVLHRINRMETDMSDKLDTATAQAQKNHDELVALLEFKDGVAEQNEALRAEVDKLKADDQVADEKVAGLQTILESTDALIADAPVVEPPVTEPEPETPAEPEVPAEPETPAEPTA